MSSSISKTADLREQVLHECIAMARYALASGLNVPPALANAIEQARFAPAGEPMDMTALVKAHAQLARLVAPATPRTLLVMGDEHEHAGRFQWAGSVGLVRRMMAAAVISVIIFVLLSATEATSASNQVGFENGFGWEVLANSVFWMSAAAMGASFALLRQVNQYIVDRTYDPKYEPTYWIKFLLGVMAGFIMAALLPTAMGFATGTAAKSDGTVSSTMALAVPTLAMLGGFSASAVFQILTKLVESVENLFRAAPGDEAAQREKAAQTRAAEELSQSRLSVAGQIVKLQNQIAAGADPAAINRVLAEITQGLVPTSAAETPAPETADAPSPASAASAPQTIVLPPDTPIVSAPQASASTDAGADAPAGSSAGDSEPAAAASASADGTAAG